VGVLDILSRKGRSLDEAITCASQATDSGFLVAVRPTVDLTTAQWRQVVQDLDGAQLASVCELWVTQDNWPTAALAHRPGVHWALIGADALELDERVREQAQQVGITVTRSADRRASESECAHAGAVRVRLTSNRPQGPSSGGGQRAYFTSRQEADKAYVRCAKALLAQSASPSFMTEDQRLIDIIRALAIRQGRANTDVEFCMEFGRRQRQAQDLSEAGYCVRYVIDFEPRELP